MYGKKAGTEKDKNTDEGHDNISAFHSSNWNFGLMPQKSISWQSVFWNLKLSFEIWKFNSKQNF